MLTRINAKNGDELSILGFGCMKFPTNGGKGNIDEPRAIVMIREAIEKGVNYFDTAYIYHNGKSEGLLGKALAGGYRERVKIATKLPPFIVRNLEGAKKIFAAQLQRLQTDCVDYYLLHMLTDKERFDFLDGLGIMKWLEELKEKGTVKNIGFSFHGLKEEFEKIIRAYPWDFCQIQYNYIDENNQAGKSGLILAAGMGIPGIVMQPQRGGKLVNHLPENVIKAFKSFDHTRSPAEWALRWVWNHPEVIVALSGMGDEAQIAENIRIAGDVRPGSLSAEELQVYGKVKSLLQENTKIHCTACGYCMPCPHGVDIPACFSCYNDRYLISKRAGFWEYYKSLGALTARPATASACTGCGKCEMHCPQNILIRERLKQVDREMGGIYMKPVLGIARKFLRIK